MREYTDCIIAGASPTDTEVYPTGSGYIIAADGGADLLRESGIIPDIVLGDMDSVSACSFGRNTEVIEFSPEKDDTDTLLAVKTGLERGCDRFFLYGCSGGRLDHTLANIQTLNYIASAGCEGYMIGDSENITVIRDSCLTLRVKPGTPVSVFSIGEKAEGVTLKGLKYSLDGAVVTDTFPIGVSNEATEEQPVIGVKKGALAVIWRCPFAVPETGRPGSED